VQRKQLSRNDRPSSAPNLSAGHSEQLWTVVSWSRLLCDSDFVANIDTLGIFSTQFFNNNSFGTGVCSTKRHRSYYMIWFINICNVLCSCKFMNFTRLAVCWCDEWQFSRLLSYEVHITSSFSHSNDCHYN